MAELVTDYLERRLRWPARFAARLHLHQCSACRRYFDQMRKTMCLLSEGPAPTPPDRLVDRLVIEASRPPNDRPGV